MFGVWDGRPGACFTRSCCVYYRTAQNFPREEGTAMLWFRPSWPATENDSAGLGRILWDLRIEYGSVVRDDPSQRWALVYPNLAASRPADTIQRWRFCLSTDRNLYIIGTQEKRPDQRTRQAVFGTQQQFAAGDWMHLAVSWTQERGELFLNGMLDASESLPEGLPWRPLPAFMQLGAIPTWINAGPDGVLSDFRLYRTALSANEVASAAGIETTT
jgi:hypothetical protein